jgi:hypothetical protein
VNIGVIQHALVRLFRGTDMPPLMARVSSFAGLNGEQIGLATHFAEERDLTVRHLQQHCYSPPDRLEGLMDWYIAACIVFVTNAHARPEALTEIGQLLGS